jgi:RHS repeat-associated protein
VVATSFIGGANDTATGLTDLGAREYQPGTGSFISPDPQLNPYDPLNLNAYAYARPQDTPCAPRHQRQGNEQLPATDSSNTNRARARIVPRRGRHNRPQLQQDR